MDNIITEADFQSWKHHPVTKVYLRYLRDYERMIAENQIGALRNTAQSPDLFTLGMFNGGINELARIGALEYADIVSFYATPPEEDKQEQEDLNAA